MMKMQKARPQHPKDKKKAAGGETPRWGTLSNGDAQRNAVTSKAFNTDKTLYVGNLDKRVTEYNLIVVFKPYGQLARVEFLWHKSGELRGQPRGYAFVEYKTRGEAVAAQRALDKRELMGRKLMVRFAEERDQSEVDVQFKTLAERRRDDITSGSGSAGVSTFDKIRAIEEKLARMEGRTLPPPPPSAAAASTTNTRYDDDNNDTGYDNDNKSDDNDVNGDGGGSREEVKQPARPSSPRAHHDGDDDNEHDENGGKNEDKEQAERDARARAIAAIANRKKPASHSSSSGNNDTDEAVSSERKGSKRHATDHNGHDDSSGSGSSKRTKAAASSSSPPHTSD